MDVRARGTSLQVRMDQELRLSRPATRAVRNGVPLVLELDVEVRDGANLTLVATEQQQFEIRYLPMSEHWQLETPDRAAPRTYPRLRHVLAELSELRLTLDAIPLAPGDYELRTRIRLDLASLPAPMQLPSLVNRTWRHDSDWTQWPFRINA